MAADKKADKKDENGSDDAAAEAKRKKKKLFLMIGLGILLVAISIGTTLLAVKLMSPKKADADSETASADESSESSAPLAPAIYFALKPNFTVNYDVNGRQRFLQTEITLMFREEAVQKILEKHMPTVRNGLVMLLSNQTFDDLQTTEGKENLRAAALKTIQDILSKEREAEPGDGKKDDSKEEKDKKDKKKPEKNKKPEPNVEQVLFTQFVMQ